MNNNVKKSKGQELYIDAKVAAVIAVTFILFLVAVITMTVSLVMDMTDDGGYVSVDDGDGDVKTPTKKPQDTGKTDTPVSGLLTVGAKTGIVLPCVTEQAVYLGTADDATLDVGGDSDINSAAIILTDITDGRVVAGKSFDEKIYPASMTKVMTLLVACEQAEKPNAYLTLTAELTKKYASSENKGASLAFEWKEGYQITVEDALHMIIYGSDTYACWLIAEHVAGGEEEFVALMNKRAEELGLTGTHFTNCTGLYNAEHYTTCREMAAIMAAAMGNETAAAILGRKDFYSVDIYDGGAVVDTKGMWAAWYTERLEAYKYPNTAPYYAGKGSDIMLVGGKTGYETVPTSCFVTVGADDVTGRKYVCVQVGRIDKSQTAVNSSVSTFDTREMYWKYAKE